MPATHHAWATTRGETLGNGMHRRMVTGAGLMVAEVIFPKGTLVARHHHANEQITQVISGALRFWFGDDDGQEVTVRAGELVTIPSNLPHRAEALEDSVTFDIFTPPRQDWLDGSDAYLRG